MSYDVWDTYDMIDDRYDWFWEYVNYGRGKQLSDRGIKELLAFMTFNIRPDEFPQGWDFKQYELELYDDFFDELVELKEEEFADYYDDVARWLESHEMFSESEMVYALREMGGLIGDSYGEAEGEEGTWLTLPSVITVENVRYVYDDLN